MTRIMFQFIMPLTVMIVVSHRNTSDPLLDRLRWARRLKTEDASTNQSIPRCEEFASISALEEWFKCTGVTPVAKADSIMSWSATKEDDDADNQENEVGDGFDRCKPKFDITIVLDGNEIK